MVDTRSITKSPDIVDIFKKEILPNVIRIHDFYVPWPAKLRRGNPLLNPEYKRGVTMFNTVNAGYSNAEYFCHDDSQPLITGYGKLVVDYTPGRDTEIGYWT